MEKKFKDSHIPEDYSKSLSTKNFLIGPAHVYRVATVLFHGVSTCLGEIKNLTIPKAIAFRSLDHQFIAGAKVEYVKNDDDPSNPSAGRWDYTWTFYEDDLKGADVIDASTSAPLVKYFIASAISLYTMKFHDAVMIVPMVTELLEYVKNYLKENVSESDEAVLTLDGVFRASAVSEDNVISYGLVPDGEMKVLIKNDNAIQEL